MVKKDNMSRAQLIGEIGLSHEGSLGLALSMIDECKNSGLDYAKFQFHSSHHESTIDENFRVKIFPQDESRRKYWDRTSFTLEEWQKIVEHCHKVGINFLCTPFSIYAAQELLNLGIREVKIGSGDALNYELLEYVKNNFDRAFISLGLINRFEILRLCEFFQDFKGDLVLFQCTSDYPAATSEVGLSMIRYIQELGFSAGLSDHTGNPHVPMAAIAVGASYVEFHVVFSKRQFGPDSESSLTFNEAATVSNFNDTWILATDPNYDKDEVSKRLLSTRHKFGRGVTVSRSVRKGELITRDLLTLKKPHGPISWEELPLILNKRATRDLQPDVHLEHSDFE
jgi:N,N'-diacetyllegionaminate synthase